MDKIASSTVFHTTLCDNRIPVKLVINSNFIASFDFCLIHTPYSLSMTSWGQRGFARFATLFFNHKARDAVEFGEYEESDEGNSIYSSTQIQKLNIITQGVKDIMCCIDQIATNRGDSILDYAVWYKDRHFGTFTYVDFITLHACECMIQAQFLAPNISWKLVKLSI